jgi:Gly-Xaa carboxypeptidase
LQSIGLLASLLVEYENKPITPYLGRTTTTYSTILCLGAYAAYLPKKVKSLIRKSVESERALRKVEEIMFQDDVIRAQAGTTQAVDLIRGGVKVNALPETAEAVINHRIATDRSEFIYPHVQFCFP